MPDPPGDPRPWTDRKDCRRCGCEIVRRDDYTKDYGPAPVCATCERKMHGLPAGGWGLAARKARLKRAAARLLRL